MCNVITNVWAKSNYEYDWLHINKALGFWKFDNNKKHKNKRSENNVYSDWGLLSDPKTVYVCVLAWRYEVGFFDMLMNAGQCD